MRSPNETYSRASGPWLPFGSDVLELIDKVTDYWDRRCGGFSGAVIDEIDNGDNPRREEIVSRLGLKNGTRLLDVGCGPGYYEMLLADTGAELHAVDYSQGMVDKARENLASKGINADVRQMNALDLDYPDGYFDAVVSRNVLWGLTEPVRAYSEILRVLRPGGRAYILDGNYYLHLFDESYRRPPAPPRSGGRDMPGSHFKFNKDQVDFKEIEILAQDLPLSRVRRPQWDVDVLCGMDCAEIDIRPVKAGVDRRVVTAFEIFIVKEDMQ